MKFQKTYRTNAAVMLMGLLLPLLFTQCSQVELPPDMTGDPVFDLTMSSSGGETLAFAGGVDGYRMFTSFEQGDDDVLTFVGEFKKEEGNADTFPSLRFEFRDLQLNSPLVDIDQVLTSIDGFYDQTLTGGVDTTYRATFTASTGQSCPNLPSSAFKWDFDDGTFGEGFSIEHEYDNNEERVVNLEVNGSDGAYVSVSRNIMFEANALSCGIDVSSSGQGNFLNLTVFPINAVQPYSFNWNFGANTQTISLVVDSSLFNQEYCVTLTDSNGCEASWCGGFFGNYEVCSAQFSYATAMEIDSTQAPAQLSRVTVIYRDGEGREYRSDRQTQNNLAYFDISGVEVFLENEFGYPTRKFGVDFNCDLMSANGEVITINSGQGIIGVAFPE